MTSTSKDLANTYQKKTQLEHIKDAPDTYIGGIEEDRVVNWTMTDEKMNHSEFIKTFDPMDSNKDELRIKKVDFV